MGMYTQMFFNAELKEDTPQNIIETIQWLCGDSDKPDALPDHEFFKSVRHEMILRGSSYYFPQTIKPKFTKDYCWRLTSLSNIKNYDNEIEKFIDFIRPYIDDGTGLDGMFAMVCYEQQSIPTMYYLSDPENEN